jgi:hypothetical protein
MRMLFIMVGSLALTLGLRIVDPSVSSAESPPATVRAADALLAPAPGAGRGREIVLVVADSADARTTGFIVPYGALKESGIAELRSISTRKMRYAGRA